MSGIATAIIAGLGTAYGIYSSEQQKKAAKKALGLYNQGKTNIPQLTSYPIGKTLNDRILAALNQGSGIGFGNDYVDRTTNPQVAQLNANFQNEQLPALNAEYGSRGLSRSTLAARDIGKAYSQQGRDINSIMGNAYLNNELQKKSDIGRYENLGLNFAGQQSNIDAQNAGLSNTYNANTYNATMGQNAADQANLNQIIGMGFSGASGAAGAYQNNQLLGIYRQELAARHSSPFVNSGTVNSSASSYALRNARLGGM